MSLDKLTTIRRTVRDPVADCPQYTSANLPEPTMSLEEIQALWRTVRSPLADRPQFNPTKPTRDNIVSGQISNTTADCPALLGGPSAVRVFNIARQAAASAAAAAAVHRRRRRTTGGGKGQGAQVTHHESILAVGSGEG